MVIAATESAKIGTRLGGAIGSPPRLAVCADTGSDTSAAAIGSAGAEAAMAMVATTEARKVRIFLEGASVTIAINYFTSLNIQSNL